MIKNAPNRPKLQESTPFDERDRLRAILTFITQAPAIFHPFCPFSVLFCDRYTLGGRGVTATPTSGNPLKIDAGRQKSKNPEVIASGTRLLFGEWGRCHPVELWSPGYLETLCFAMRGERYACEAKGEAWNAAGRSRAPYVIFRRKLFFQRWGITLLAK